MLRLMNVYLVYFLFSVYFLNVIVSGGFFQSIILFSFIIIINNSTFTDNKCIAWMHCKWLWIQASAKCINVITIINIYFIVDVLTRII